MNILIVDDEPPARQRLVALVQESGLGCVVGEAGNGRDALQIAEKEALDLVLLDIRMPGMDGLEVARHLSSVEHPPAVIFTTAYDNHALAAFEANAIDYLLKPIRAERLTKALERAARPTRAQLAGLRHSGAVSRARTHVSATLLDKLRLVPIEEVRYFRAEHKYVTAGYPGGELLLDDSLSALEEEFADRFLRVHRNALIARVYVHTMFKGTHGSTFVSLAGVDTRIEVSRRMAVAVRRALKTGTSGSPVASREAPG